jgi:hypothetical protein
VRVFGGKDVGRRLVAPSVRKRAEPGPQPRLIGREGGELGKPVGLEVDAHQLFQWELLFRVFAQEGLQGGLFLARPSQASVRRGQRVEEPRVAGVVSERGQRRRDGRRKIAPEDRQPRQDRGRSRVPAARQFLPQDPLDERGVERSAFRQQGPGRGGEGPAFEGAPGVGKSSVERLVLDGPQIGLPIVQDDVRGVPPGPLGRGAAQQVGELVSPGLQQERVERVAARQILMGLKVPGVVRSRQKHDEVGARSGRKGRQQVQSGAGRAAAEAFVDHPEHARAGPLVEDLLELVRIAPAADSPGVGIPHAEDREAPGPFRSALEAAEDPAADGETGLQKQERGQDAAQGKRPIPGGGSGRRPPLGQRVPSSAAVKATSWSPCRRISSGPIFRSRPTATAEWCSAASSRRSGPASTATRPRQAQT